MDNRILEAWCDEATAKIQYKPDRLAVKAELMAHLEESYDACTNMGMDPQEARQKVLANMGSAKVIAPQLAALHKPWLGYLFSLVRIAAVIAATLAIFYAITSAWPLVYNTVGANHFDFLPNNYGALDYFSYPNVSDRSDGRYYQVTEAGYSKARSEFHVEIRVIFWPHLRSWNGLSDFWAVDSLGNYYASYQEAGYDDIPHVRHGSFSSSACIGHYELTITHFDCNAQWVELHYDKDGRDLVLRIDLTGGGEHDKP